MLNSIRKFSRTLFAKILIVIIIIPFIFWGMGGLFNSGNSNNIAKINNKSISTQDFINYINQSKINPEILKKNLDNNVLEELLSMLVSQKLLEMEIEDLNVNISDTTLIKKIKSNENFHDDSKKFSRFKYEKFLLSQNLTAANFEKQLKDNELKKKLFSYVGGGIKSPFFFANNSYKEETSKLEIEFINLENEYQKQNSFTDEDITAFINDNIEELKEEYIDFSYIKITPSNLTGIDEFNENFFKKIDEIENDISNGIEIKELSEKLKIKETVKKNYIFNEENDAISNKIYDKRNENKIQLIDENDYYILYQIFKVNKILPKKNNLKFRNTITNTLFVKKKYEYNKKIIEKINDKKFNSSTFEKISNGNQKKFTIDSINDISKFTKDSIRLLYSLPLNSFTLISDEKNNVYLVKITGINNTSLFNNSDLILEYSNLSNKKIRENLFQSFDFFIEEKYKVKVNQKTLERVKNYFR